MCSSRSGTSTTCTSSCPSGPRPEGRRERRRDTLVSIRLQGLRGYASLDAAFGPGPQLVWGPNAAGKTSLLEAVVLLATGASHRTTADLDLIRWGDELARAEGTIAGPGAGRDESIVEVAVVRSGAGARKRIRVNGVPRRVASLAGLLRVVLFAPEEMLLVAGPPGLRRSAIDEAASQRSPAYAADLATYGRALAQRNRLLRAIREEAADRAQLRYWDAPLLDAGAAIVEARLRLLDELAGPLAGAHAEIAPDEAAQAALTLGYRSNVVFAPGRPIRDALARRLAETAEKEVWNGTTLVGPHRDDVAFELGGRQLAGSGSRGQQRTAILAFKLAQLDLLTTHDGRPPLLLLDDVFSELDPERRGHLVRRIASLPQAFVTTTTPGDLDPALVAASTSWEVRADGPNGASLAPAAAPTARTAR